jgi:hypothetical protein
MTIGEGEAGRMGRGRYWDVTLGAVILGGQVDLRMTAGPWWAGFLLAVLGLVTAGVRIVFPQDSPDKLAWWRERWRVSSRLKARGRARGGKRHEGRE